MSIALNVFVIAVFAVAALGWVYALHVAVRQWRQRGLAAPHAAHHATPNGAHHPARRRESIPRPAHHPSGRHHRVITAAGARSASTSATDMSAAPPSPAATER
jgi:hypothetical protein